ncbi:hypothetical protein Taro_003144 [Colocasia esculenta]|uniref:Uncharacterized protein n=1 Tax=Colocasia esculenta TaxID=4460 RepID=A0A843TIV3_COLES|nr:hypothetical protein [Colocasia esculenta]
MLGLCYQGNVGTVWVVWTRIAINIEGLSRYGSTVEVSVVFLDTLTHVFE